MARGCVLSSGGRPLTTKPVWRSGFFAFCFGLDGASGRNVLGGWRLHNVEIFENTLRGDNTLVLSPAEPRRLWNYRANHGLEATKGSRVLFHFVLGALEGRSAWGKGNRGMVQGTGGTRKHISVRGAGWNVCTDVYIMPRGQFQEVCCGILRSGRCGVAGTPGMRDEPDEAKASRSVFQSVQAGACPRVALNPCSAKSAPC